MKEITSTDPIVEPFKFTSGYDLTIYDLGFSKLSSETCTKHKGILIQLTTSEDDCASIVLPPEERARLTYWLRKFERFEKRDGPSRRPQEMKEE